MKRIPTISQLSPALTSIECAFSTRKPRQGSGSGYNFHLSTRPCRQRIKSTLAPSASKPFPQNVTTADQISTSSSKQGGVSLAYFGCIIGVCHHGFLPRPGRYDLRNDMKRYCTKHGKIREEIVSMLSGLSQQISPCAESSSQNSVEKC